MKLKFGGSPKDWVVRDGLPARVLGDPVKTNTGGLPSAEDDDGFVVYETMVAFKGGLGQLMLFPQHYGLTAECFGGGLVPLHHQPCQRCSTGATASTRCMRRSTTAPMPSASS